MLWCLQEPIYLYGVDVTCSRYLRRPEVMRAAHFAADAHKGQASPLSYPMPNSSLGCTIWLPSLTMVSGMVFARVDNSVCSCSGLQKRLTGDPYIVHCVETAAIVECLHATSNLDEMDERWVPCLPVCQSKLQRPSKLCIKFHIRRVYML